MFRREGWGFKCFSREGRGSNVSVGRDRVSSVTEERERASSVRSHFTIGRLLSSNIQASNDGGTKLRAWEE